MSYPAGAPQEQQQQEEVAVEALSNNNLNHQIHSNDPSGSSDNSSSSRSTTVSPGSAETTASSATGNTGNNSNRKPGSSNSQQNSQQNSHPYRNILTHQERKKLRMPKRKADSWPASILADPDVLSLDDEGRFVLCKVCHVHYAVHGGKKPKPVIMNSSFRTRAWDVHKERTNSHRMQKKQDDHHRQPHTMVADENEQKAPARDTKSHNTENSSASAQQQQQKPQVQQQQQQQQKAQAAQAHLQQALADEQQQVRFAPSALRSHSPLGHSPLSHSPLGRPEFISPPPPSPHRRVFRPNAQLGAHQWQPSDHDVHRRNSHASAHDHHRLNADPPATSVVSVAATAGAIGSKSSLPTVSVTASASSHGRKAMTNTSMASEQRDGMMRWQNMHDHVSRALTMPKRPAQDQFPSAELRDSNAALGETEDFGVNNEKVAKKLKSLDDEYDAKILKRPDVHYDRRSANYKQYWGTLRDVYTAPTTTTLNSNNHNSNHNSSSNNMSNSRGGGVHKTLPSLRQQQQRENSGSNNNYSSNHKDTLQDVGNSTTPDDTGSSEDSAKTIVVHDQALVNAIDRLTGIVSKQLSSSERHAQESSATVDALTSLATAVTEMRVHQDNAFGRLIELQEQRLQVTEAILQHKLRKEARSNSNSGSNSSNSGAAS